MIEKFTAWLLELVIKALKALFTLISDVFVNIAEVVLNALAALLAAIPAPDFLTDYSLTKLLQGLPLDVAYFVGVLKLPIALGIIASGFVFYIGRKIVTLGQW